MKRFFICMLLSIVLSGCGSGVVEPRKNHVIYFGDSLVHQSGDRLQTLLQTYPEYGNILSDVDNRGLDAQMAYHALYGIYGNLDVTTNNPDTIFVFAWGTNEALQGISDEQYESNIRDVLNRVNGYRVIIESPPLITNPQNNAHITVVRFRVILKRIGIEKNITVVDLASTPAFEDGGIHPTSDGYDYRAKALAETILKTK